MSVPDAVSSDAARRGQTCLPPGRLRLAVAATMVALMASGAMFGFFFASVSSTMWGLDAIDPRVAMAAMQGMNASVRNPVFGLAFFGTPVVAAMAVGVALWAGQRQAAALLGAGLVACTLGAFLLTLTVNVPMNTALEGLPVPQDRAEAEVIWLAYSPPWQVFNAVRAVVSGTTLALTAAALVRLGRAQGRLQA